MKTLASADSVAEQFDELNSTSMASNGFFEDAKVFGCCRNGVRDALPILPLQSQPLRECSEDV
jgi:hypothetical protein